MQLFHKLVFLGCLSTFSILWAVPGTLENTDYKINFSETLRGVDSQPMTLGGPVIYVDVTDKFRSQGTRFPLEVYAINQYFLDDDRLNLICRTTPRDTFHQLYSFIQLNLTDHQDSRQFQGMEKFFFSPDNRFLVAAFDQGGPPESIGFIRLSQGPARLGWLYSEKEKLNLFQKALPEIGKHLSLASVVGWMADSLTAVFVLSENVGTAESPVLKYYLTCLYLEEDGFKVAAEAVDLSPYQLPDGGMIDTISCSGDHATLYFQPKDLSGTSQADFKLPKTPDH